MNWNMISAGFFILGSLLFLGTCARAEPIYVNKCSGTYIGEGYVLTAAHCVLGEVQTTLRKDALADDAKDEDKGGWTAKVIITDNLHDFAIVKFDKALVQSEKDKSVWEPKTDVVIADLKFKATKVGCEYPKLRQHYLVKGWPMGEYAETIGYVAGPKKKIAVWAVAYMFVGAGFYGSSGSGVYNELTDTVDAVFVGMIQGSGLYIIIPTAEICNILPREIK